jgi:hypothetical protein
MALQRTAVVNQWQYSDNLEIPRETNATMTQERRNGVFFAVRAEMLQAGECERS